MAKSNQNQKIAEWYAQQIMEHSTTPYDEIEWLVLNLKQDALDYTKEIYNEYNSQ